MTAAAAGAVGGSSNEIGSAHRAGAVAVMVVYGLLGRGVEGLFPQSGGSPAALRAETDDSTDDIKCVTEQGRTAWVQCKHDVSVGVAAVGLAPVVGQWASAVRAGQVEPGDALVLAVARLSGPLKSLRSALNRRRDPHSGAMTSAQAEALQKLLAQVQSVAPDLDEASRARLLDAAVIWHVDASDAENVFTGHPVLGQHSLLGAAMLGSIVGQDAAPQAMAVLAAAARNLARHRSGADIAKWRQILETAGIRILPRPERDRLIRLLPAPAHLVGRDDILDDLRRRLRQPDTSSPAVIALCGLGGIGKTSIALAFAHRNRDDYGIIWQIDADSPSGTANDFAELARHFGAHSDASKHLDPVRQVHNVLASYAGRWLLIFDNAHEPASLRTLIPPAGNGEIIITSRNTTWPLFQKLGVPALDPDDASAFLQERSGDHTSAEVTGLAEKLGCLPLALEQAGAYCAAAAITLTQYAELLRDNRSELLARAQPTDYPDTVATTWLVTFKQLAKSAPDAITLLRLLAFCAPAPVPLSLLFQPDMKVTHESYGDLSGSLQSLLASQISINDTVAALTRFSLARPLSTGVLEVHRLVQAVVREQIPPLQRHSWQAALAGLINAALPASPELPASWPAFAALTPHALAALDAMAMRPITRYLQSIGNYRTAVVVQEHICEAVIDTYGDQRPEFVTEMANLFYAYGAAGDAGQARDGIAGMLRGLADVMPADDWFTLYLRSQHARWTGAAGDPAAAIKLFTELRPVLLRVLGPHHTTTLMAGYNHAAMCRDAGDPNSARDMFAEMLPAFMNHYGPTHPETLTMRAGIALMTAELGDELTAMAQYRELLPVMQEVLGEAHPDVLSERTNFAVITIRAGDVAAGLDMLLLLHPLLVKVHGSDAPRTAEVGALIAGLTAARNGGAA